MDKELILGFTGSKCATQIQIVSSEFMFLIITLYHLSRERLTEIDS